MRQLEINKELVEFHRRKNGMSVTEFCKECGISKRTYDKILNSEKCNELSALRIALKMGINLKEIYPPWKPEEDDYNT